MLVKGLGCWRKDWGAGDRTGVLAEGLACLWRDWGAGKDYQGA